MARVTSRRAAAGALSVLCLILSSLLALRLSQPRRLNPTLAALNQQLPPSWIHGMLLAVIARLPLWYSRLLPPQLAAISLAGSFLQSQALSVACKLGLAEHLAAGPLPMGELARRAGARPDRLARMLRALAASGVFEEPGPGLVGNNRVSEVLRADHPRSVRSLVLHFTQESFWAAEKMYESVLVGATLPAFQLQSGGVGYWEWLEQAGHEGLRENFARAMVETSSLSNPALLVDYPWHLHAGQTVVDVGGGVGGFLAQLLRAYPSLRGVLFDREAVIEQARGLWRAEHPELVGRVAFQGGSFFERVPQGDVYFLRNILHDWNGTSALAILGAVRGSMAGGAGASTTAPAGPQLILAESLVPDHQPIGLAGMVDLQMMALLDGQQRTRPELATLLKGAGFVLRHVVPTRSGLSLLVAQPE